VVLLLAGCAPREVIQPGRPVSHTTINRYTSAPSDCPKPTTKDTELRRVTASRDEWKRYAESLEKLIPSDAEHGPHP
jgi:hypothetical protein